jgi:FtsP/CotA-like multicopper oxidase with cupredoxin domain
VKTRRLLNILFSILIVASMLMAATSQVSAKTPTPPAPKPPTHIHQGKVTPADRQAAAQRAAKARAAAGLSAQNVTLQPGVADYFGTTPNYAISPIPASVSIMGDGVGAIFTPVLDASGTVTGFVPAVAATTVAPFLPASFGSGYTLAATTVTVIGGGHIVSPTTGQTGCNGIPTISTVAVPATATSAAIPVGAITAITVDPASGLNCGGFDPAHGIKKFQDTLPMLTGNPANNLLQNLVVAQAQTLAGFPNDDYYEIHLQDHPWTFNSSLPPTTVRGYVQYIGGVAQSYSYLGPIIVAQKDKPVRILFVNDLPNGAGGNLFIPVDTTVMGAGMGPTGGMYTQNRAELHLHGGATPWISDGTPHQWTTPVGSTATYPEGVSVYNVPDMGAQPVGQLTYYYTNQQSARLMFYHDHSYGITRLNVYAGEAAGYEVTDPIEQAMVGGGSITSTLPTAVTHITGGSVDAINFNKDVNGNDLRGANYTSIPTITLDPSPTPGCGLSPNATAVASINAGVVTNVAITNPGCGYVTAPNVVFSSTTFAPVAGTIPATQIPLVFQDKTFVDTNDIMRSDPTYSQSGGLVAQGALWYPHVYMPNQNPFDLMGVNNNGRWDWGPWFWPPWTVTNPALPNPYAGQSAEEGPVIPSTPNPSVVPEGYMDTPLVNGVAYPVLNIAPGQVRFRILNASNDRYMNLSLFCAKSQVASTAPTGGMWNGNVLQDANMGEVNMVPAAPSTGLPANWPTDGRDGGVPDPAAAGPSWVVIGTEGGILPAPAIVPPQPVGYEYNRRSITVLNVLQKGLYIGPAERYDVVVDFNTASCQRLIVYNDAPAPMPAFDPRNDYYTNDPDNTSTGGAPSTAPGYGPNTRTVMMINLTSVPAGATLNTTNITTYLPQAFAATQDAPVVPEPAFNTAMGYTAPLTNYARIQDMSMGWFNGPLTKINVTAGGLNYLPATTNVAISGGGGTSATATAVITPVVLTKLNLLTPGSGFTANPTVTITGGGGAGAAGTATFTKIVKSIAVSNGGSNYTTVPTVTFTGGGGTGAIATAVLNTTTHKVASITVNFGGSGYTSAPTVTITGGGGTGAKATASITGVVNAVTLTNPGAGYQTVPTVAITGGGGTGASASFTINPGVITAITLTNPGANFTSTPTVTITGGNGLATAVPVGVNINFGPKAIQELFDNDYGRMNATLGVELPNTNGTTQTTIPYGYIDPPTDMFGISDPTTYIGQLGDGTTLWKITHNGVDSHPLHFHMFNIQLINRVGWDGMVKPPLPMEVGWKDTVILNPLEDAVVAFRPMPLKNLPWQLPNSIRALDPAMPIGSTSQFSGIDPLNQPVTVVNQVINYGWEYVWHCHILGHEENDFMRPMLAAGNPADPSLLVAAGVTGKAQINLSFKDNSLNETGFRVMRSTSPNGPWTLVKLLPASAGTGLTVAYTDTTVKRLTQYYYQVIAVNTVGATQASGFTTAITGYPTFTASSNIVSIAVKSK